MRKLFCFCFCITIFIIHWLYHADDSMMLIYTLRQHSMGCFCAGLSAGLSFIIVDWIGPILLSILSGKKGFNHYLVQNMPQRNSSSRLNHSGLLDNRLYCELKTKCVDAPDHCCASRAVLARFPLICPHCSYIYYIYSVLIELNLH